MRRPLPSRLPVAGAALLALVLSVALATAPTRASAAAPPHWHGVPVALGPLSTPELAQAQALGAADVELFAQWSTIEAAGPGSYDPTTLGRLDAAVQGAAALGMKVILRVRGTPCWTSTEPPEAKAQRPDLCSAYPPRSAQQFGDFVSFIVNRYAGKLAAIEVWAEEDHADGQHFAGPDPAGHYAALLKAAHAAVQHSSAPTTPVLIGALVGADGAFLKALYRDGVKGNYNGVAVDFYDLVLASLRSIHQVQLAAGDHTPLWLEEFGWTTCSSPRSIAEKYFACVNPQQQARNLDDIFRGLAMVPWVQNATVFTLRDNPSLHFGISDEFGNPKPAFTMLSADWHGGIGAPRPVTLKLVGHGQHAALVGTAPVGDVVELALTPPHHRGRAVQANLRLSVNGTFAWHLPRQVGRGWRASATEPWTHGSAHLILGGARARARASRIEVNCGGSGMSALYCIPQQSVFAFARIGKAPHCSLSATFTVEPSIEGLHGYAHLTLQGLQRTDRQVARHAKPRVGGGVYTLRFSHLAPGAYRLSGWYGGDSTRLPSAHRSRRVVVRCTSTSVRGRAARASRKHKPKRKHAKPHRKAYPLKMIWGPFTMPNGSSAFPVYHQLGVQVLQTQLSWAATAPQRPADPANPADPAYRWPAALDQAVREAPRYHIRLAVMLRGSPPWSNGGQDPSWAPSDPNDYANFAAAASRRYPTIHHWMIWGEPERPGNFNPMPENSPVGPQRYALLLDAAYGSLKAVSPANIVIGGMTYTVGLDSTADFIRWMRLPNGAPPRLDYFGHNPYSTRYPKLSEGLYEAKVRDINDIDTLHSELAAAYQGRPGGTPKLWLSEFSISSDHTDRAFWFFVSRPVQAKWATAAFKLVDSVNYVVGLGWYELMDEPPTIPGFLTEGLMTAEGAPKPAFYAYQHAP